MGDKGVQTQPATLAESQTSTILTDKVGANLQSLVSSHDHSDLSTLSVLQELDITRSPLLPLDSRLVKPEKLGPHLEQDILVLFVCLDFYLLSELDDGLKVGVVLLGLRGARSRRGKCKWNMTPRYHKIISHRS